MREIKFRAKRKKNNEWIKGSLYVNQLTKECAILQYSGGYEVIPETVGQYTGFKDKNGKEIYEGDILKIINGSINGKVFPYNVEAKWINDDGCWNIPNFKNAYKETHNFEVIGNIYDNPELLEVDE